MVDGNNSRTPGPSAACGQGDSSPTIFNSLRSRQSGHIVHKLVILIVLLMIFGKPILDVGRQVALYFQVERVFRVVVKSDAVRTEFEARHGLPDAFRQINLDPERLPPDYYDNLQVLFDGEWMIVQSKWVAHIWPLGVPLCNRPGYVYGTYRNPEVERFMDSLRLKAEIQITFKPSAIARKERLHWL